MNKLSSLLSILASGSLVLVACSGDPKDKENAPASSAVTEKAISVVTRTLQASRFEDWVAYPAELKGVQDVSLSAGGGGRVLSVVEAGTRVAQGQALCDIESERYAALQAQAQAAFDLAQGEWNRTEANVNAGSMGKAALDNAKLNLEGARVNVFQAKRAYEDSRCEAPFHGVVVSRAIEKFQTVAPGASTLRLARTDRFEALVSLSESDLNAYNKGALVRFSVPSLPGREFDGKLKALDLVVDSRTRTASARLEIGNQNGVLVPGMAGRALLLRKVYEDVVVVPATALLRNESGVFAMVAEKGTAHERSVVLGPSHGDSVVVLSGLKQGEHLVVEGAFKATDGSKLSVSSSDRAEAP